MAHVPERPGSPRIHIQQQHEPTIPEDAELDEQGSGVPQELLLGLAAFASEPEPSPYESAAQGGPFGAASPPAAPPGPGSGAASAGLAAAPPLPPAAVPRFASAPADLPPGAAQPTKPRTKLFQMASASAAFLKQQLQPQTSLRPRRKGSPGGGDPPLQPLKHAYTESPAVLKGYAAAG